MTNEPTPIADKQLDAYLDGLMTASERASFEVQLRDHPEALKAVELQASVNSALKRLFPQQQASEAQIKELLAEFAPAAPTVLSTELRHRPTRYAVQVALVGLAASVAWIAISWQLGEPPAMSPFFQPQPVSQVYQHVVANGFEPYYECREEDRFAATFLRRQGRALRLATLPSGSRMLGLSYPGGLSRDTTAMLCRVDGEPVMVFVDRLENDSPIAMQSGDSKISVHRTAKDGLVLYEVNPFETARVIEYLVAN